MPPCRHDPSDASDPSACQAREMGVYEDQLLPRVIDVMLGNAAIGKMRRRALEGVSGTVLEIGFGSGTNLDHYPPEVERVLAVDPALVGRKLAAKRLRRTRIEVEFVGLDGQSVPLPDDSVDHAVSTFTLCTVPDEAAALAEVRRIVRPGGRLFFLEHGLADDHRTAHRQHRLNPIQRRVAGGCNLNRPHDRLIAEAGLLLERIDRFQIAGPKTMSQMYAGQAVVPA